MSVLIFVLQIWVGVVHHPLSQSLSFSLLELLENHTSKSRRESVEISIELLICVSSFKEYHIKGESAYN